MISYPHTKNKEIQNLDLNNTFSQDYFFLMSHCPPLKEFGVI